MLSTAIPRVSAWSWAVLACKGKTHPAVKLVGSNIAIAGRLLVLLLLADCRAHDQVDTYGLGLPLSHALMATQCKCHVSFGISSSVAHDRNDTLASRHHYITTSLTW